MVDYVCCDNCGHMIVKEKIDMHEAWSCTSLPPKEAPPDLAENSQNSMDSNSVLSDDSDSSEVMRRRRKQARYEACVAQARAVGMVEDGREVDFSIAPYAAITPRTPLVSKEGNVYNNNDTQCLEDYIACARAIGLIEDGAGDNLTNDCAYLPSPTPVRLGVIMLAWSLVGGAMSFMQGASVVEGVMRGAATASVAGSVIAAGSSILSQA